MGKDPAGDLDSVILVQSVDDHLVLISEEKRQLLEKRAKADQVSKEIAKHGVLGRFLRRKK